MRRHLLLGRPADILCETVAVSNVDLVVMTTHGRGPLSRLWFGSVTTELIQRLTVLLLLLRPTENAMDLSLDPAPRRALLPLDGSPFAEDVIPLAIAVGMLTGAAYRLLRVAPPVASDDWGWRSTPPPSERPASELLEAEARSYLSVLTTQRRNLRERKHK